MTKTPHQSDEPLRLQKAQTEDILPLRHCILRKNLPFETAKFDGDDEPSTLHAVVKTEEGRIIACATIMLRDEPGIVSDGVCEIGKMFRLRGMAVEEGRQRRGLGTALLKYAEFLALQRGAKVLWLDARVFALGFYEKHGYAAYGEKFTVPTAGDHFKMYKILAYHECDGCRQGK